MDPSDIPEPDAPEPDAPEQDADPSDALEPAEDRVRRVLVLARASDALRLIRAARAVGMEVVVPCASDELEARWVRAADDAVVFTEADPRPETVVDAAMDAGCDGVMPGPDGHWRDPILAALVARAGLRWLGVPRAQLDYVCERKRVRELAEEVGLPTVPGTAPIADVGEALTWVGTVGLPVLLRSGADPDVRVRVDTLEELQVAFQGLLETGPVRVERYVLDAREIEVPLVGDGEHALVSLGTREVAGAIAGGRRVFAAPAADLDEDLGEDLQRVALALGSILEWRGVGAVQFLITPDGRPYLLDIRGGLARGDAATEAAFGVDLADAALRVGQGQPLLWQSGGMIAGGYALLLRLVARPEPGGWWRVGHTETPGDMLLAAAEGDPVRTGDVLGEIILHGESRASVLVRAKVALDDVDVEGVPCAVPGLRRLVSAPEFWEAPLGREGVARVVGADPEAPSVG